MRFELGSEVIGFFVTFFATHPIVAANPVNVAEAVNVFTGLLSDILFWQTKKKSIGFTLTGSLTGVSPERLELTLLCLSLWFWFINESHQLFSFIAKSSQWELHLLLKEFEWVRMTMMFPSSGSNPSDCFEPPFFFFSSLTLLLYSASFLPAYLGLLVDFYEVHSKAWPFKFSATQPSSKSLSWCFFSLSFFIPHFIC